MKIIGRGAHQQVILEATTDELAKLIGLPGAYAKTCPQFNPGISINIDRMYEVVARREDYRRQLNDARERLRSVLVYLAPVEALAFPPDKPDGQA